MTFESLNIPLISVSSQRSVVKNNHAANNCENFICFAYWTIFNKCRSRWVDRFRLAIIKVSLYSIDIQTFQLETDEDCFSPSINQSGICIHYDECLTDHKLKNLKICSFAGRIPIVCCPVSVSSTHQNLKTTTNSRRISEISKKIVIIYSEKFWLVIF